MSKIEAAKQLVICDTGTWRLDRSENADEMPQERFTALLTWWRYSNTFARQAATDYTTVRASTAIVPSHDPPLIMVRFANSDLPKAAVYIVCKISSIRVLSWNRLTDSRQ